jgi:hypothetical protein
MELTEQRKKAIELIEHELVTKRGDETNVIENIAFDLMVLQDLRTEKLHEIANLSEASEPDELEEQNTIIKELLLTNETQILINNALSERGHYERIVNKLVKVEKPIAIVGKAYALKDSKGDKNFIVTKI